MSTQKWSDDELDAFFRKSAEEADPAYDPAAWQDLQARLNDRDRTRLLKWALPLLLLLVLTGSVIWYVRFTNKPAQMASKPTTVETTEIGSIPTAEPQTSVAPAGPTTKQRITRLPATATSQPAGLVHTTDADKLIASSNAKTRIAKSAPSSPEVRSSAERLSTVPTHPYPEHVVNDVLRQPVAAPNRTRPTATKDRFATGGSPTDISSQQRNGSPEFANDTKTKQKTLLGLKAKRALAANQLVKRRNDKARQDAKTGGLGRHRSVESGLVTNQVPGSRTSPDNLPGAEYVQSVSAAPSLIAEDQQSLDTRFVWPTLETLTSKGMKWPRQPPLLAEPDAPEPDVTRSRPIRSRSRLMGLSIQVVFSPDLSTIGLHNFDRPGSNIGVMAQYQLSQRFSLQAGALWSTKLYTTTPSEYTSPVYMHVLPESITGRCTMFDIPVNLRYDVLLRPGGAARGPKRWFVSGGVTSYFIDHEAYNFNFKNPDDPGITARGWDNRVAGRKGGSFGLSNLNVSVGYEQPISRRLSWQLEPFMKIPLKQVGYYKVKLISTGAFLSLRYRL